MFLQVKAVEILMKEPNDAGNRIGGKCMANKRVKLTLKNVNPFTQEANVIVCYTIDTETPNFERGVHFKRLADDQEI